MNKVAIAFSTKDRVELSRQTIKSLQSQPFDLFIIDGSETQEGIDFAGSFYEPDAVHTGVKGGADAAIVYALTAMLNARNRYDYVGLVENDVLLDPDWFEPTMNLFTLGERDGFSVGAVSARTYEDRILCQHHTYSLMHNTGAGMLLLSRVAALLVLDEFRTTQAFENRAVFAQLANTDIGRYWAFRGSQHWLSSDWGYDVTLARHGLASLSLTPTKARMIGQDITSQGLTLATKPVELLRDSARFNAHRNSLERVRDGDLALPPARLARDPETGSQTIFPHQIHFVGGSYSGDWRLQWSQGYGPFAWRAKSAGASLMVPVFGSCAFTVTGPGRFEVHDYASGYTASPELRSEPINLSVPGGMTYRLLRLTALDLGVTFYSLQARDPQPTVGDRTFDWSVLPPVE